jgi:ectoine hydroxylase-related dioxygenase (phytanoyl-CoA dioxygenase family)
VIQACAKPGDVILFNGKILHRGRANVSDKSRGVLYVSHTKRWYDDSYQ